MSCAVTAGVSVLKKKGGEKGDVTRKMLPSYNAVLQCRIYSDLIVAARARLRIPKSELEYISGGYPLIRCVQFIRHDKIDGPHTHSM